MGTQHFQSNDQKTFGTWFFPSICITKCHVRLEMEWIPQSNQSKIITRWSEESGQKIGEGSKQEQVVGIEMYVCEHPGWTKSNTGCRDQYNSYVQ